MIFDVYMDGKLLYYPNDETYVITNSKLELALNEAGSFEFDIPSCNLRYDDFQLRKSMISVRQNDVEIFYGEVREVTQNFDFTKHVYVVGELAFLFDSIQPQKVYQGTPYEMLKSMLAYHNSQVESRKKFNIGYVNSTDNYVYHFTNREDTLSDIRDKLCDTLNVYIKIRKVNGTKYLDLVPLANYGQYCKQEIQFGENLINYSCNMSAADIATCCVPLGKRLENEERTANAVDGLDEYLTIVGTDANAYHKNKDYDYVQNDSAIAQFGYVRVVKNWDDVTDKTNLRDKAIEWLKSTQFETMTLELSAFDMNLLDANIDSFDVGDTIHAWALPYGMDTTFPVQKKTIYLNDLEKNTVILGQSFTKSYTKQASKAIEILTEELPEITPILKSAKDNALAMLLAETTGGHVVYEYDSTSSYIEAINVCNATKIENSTKRWVWNLNGFGFMSRNTKNDKWSNLSTAITMDGKIVANFITAGEMSANRIKGGTLEVGGKQYLADGKTSNPASSGTIKIYNTSGTEIGSWTSAGITINEGAINLGIYDVKDEKGNVKKDSSGNVIKDHYFKVNNKGQLTATNGTIGGWTIGENSLSADIVTVNPENTKQTKKGTISLNSDGSIKTTGLWGKVEIDPVSRIQASEFEAHARGNDTTQCTYSGSGVTYARDTTNGVGYSYNWSEVVTTNSTNNFSTLLSNSNVLYGNGCDGQFSTNSQVITVRNGLVTSISTY